MDIVCRKYSCEHNKDCKCTRKHLSVDKKADCEDLNIDENKKVEDVSKDMFEHEPDVAPFKHCKCVDIKCGAENCVFNNSGECVSNGILVGSEKMKAPCNTYMEK